MPKTLEKDPKDKEIKEGVGLTLGLIAGAPGLMNALGKGVNWVSSFFQKDGKNLSNSTVVLVLSCITKDQDKPVTLEMLLLDYLSGLKMRFLIL